jgi:predicted ATP-grasp superfamily ATP-dependent carboligase
VGTPEAGHTVLVVPADTFIALTVVRSLGRRGVRVVGLSSDEGVGQFSRYCAAHWDMPKNKDDLGKVVLELVRKEKITHIFATSDPAIMRLNRDREALEQHATLLFPPPETVALAIHKDKTLACARRVGIPCPQTLVIRSEADIAQAADLQFPAVLKPRHQDIAAPAGPRPAFRVKYCASYEELVRELSAFRESGDYPLVQEYCEGRGAGIEVLMRKGQPVLLFQHRRIREYPVSGGVSTCCQSVELDPRLRDWSIALLREMQWDGVAMVEFRQDPATGRAVLMEVNGRLWGSIPLAVHARCDFPYELFRTSLPGATLQAPPPYQVGLQCRFLAAETKWLKAAVLHSPIPAWKAIAQYLSGFRPDMTYYVWAWDDPRPALATFFGRIQRLFSGLVRR